MSRYVSYRDFDWLLVIFVLLLCGLGVMEIRSATMHTKFAGAHIKQLYWVAGGILGMFLVSLLNYQALLEQVHWMYIAAVGSLMSVMVFGKVYLGAKRWIKLPGGQHFQPSEWVKLILILAVAKYFADLHSRELSWSDFIKAGAMVGVPMLMVLAQPDLGTALTYMPIAIMGLFLGGVRAKQALIVLLLAGLIMPLAWHKLKPYQKDRLISFMEPEADKQGSGYQVIQSKIAVGSGMLWGRGFLRGTQNHLNFLPEQHTDFIFSVFSEEFGFIGAAALMALYLGLLLRGLSIAARARDRFGVLLVLGIMSIVFWQVVVNVGMVTGLLPVVGIPLPFFSYGGSSLLGLLIGTGLVMNVSMRRHLF